MMGLENVTLGTSIYMKSRLNHKLPIPYCMGICLAVIVRDIA